jgi:outer membrane protein assembly complex protein YaeT
MAALLSMAWAGAAAGENWFGQPVAEIAFSPPAQPIPPARLAELIPLQTGQRLDADVVRRSIQAMFATGRYADIRVDAAPGEGGVKVTFLTTDNWFIGPVKILGVPEPPSQGEMLTVLKLELGDVFSEEKVAAGREALRKLLADNGYHRATVEAETSAHSDTQQIDIVFQTEPGERARFGELRLAGKPDLSVEQVRRIAGWSALRRFTQPAVQRGLERLRRHYQKNDRLQASLRVVEQTWVPAADRVNLTLELLPGPRVEVAISGAKLSRGQLRRYVPIYEEGTVDRDLLAEGARNLRDHFQVQGYFEAKIDYQQHPEENGVILVEFQAILGERHRFVLLDITGNRFFDEPTIRERMYLQPRSVQFRRGRFSQSLLRSDIASIEELYRSNGFQEARVEAQFEDDYQGKLGDLAVFLKITEGPQTLVSGLTITGNEAMPAQDFRDQLSSVEGQPFSENNVAADRDLILGRYFSAGFPDATLEWKPEPGPEPHTVRLAYSIQEGRRQFVHQIIVDGFENTQEAVIRRQLVVYPSDPLAQGAMIESQRRLYDLGIFSKINVALQNPEGLEAYRNVLFQVEEARRWTFGIGGGAEVARFGGSQTDLDSPAGDTGFSPRVAFEVGRLNLLGRAYTASVRTQFSSLQQRGLFTFQAPRWRGRERLTLTVSSLYDTSRNVRTFSATRLEGAIQLQHRISKPSTLFYRYSYRRVDVDEDTLKITPDLIPLLSQPVRVGLLSGSLAQDRRDDPLDTKRGIYNTLDLGLAGKFTFSKSSFGRLLAQNSTYHRIGRRLVLARTTQLGALVPYAARRVETRLPDGSTEVQFTRDIPLPERFFSGGSNSHRGFSINQAGPRDPTTGFPLGGNSLLLNSVELRFPLRGENVGGVLFHDAGNVYSKPGNLNLRLKQRTIQDFDYLVNAVGFGIRYRTPIGPIRFDVAYSANSPRFVGCRGSREDLLFGRCTRTEQQLSHLQFHFSLGQTF